MNIRINYDLIEKIQEAKVGFSLNKMTRKVTAFASLATIILSDSDLRDIKSWVQTVNYFSFCFIWYSLLTMPEILKYKSEQPKSIEEIKKLVQSLGISRLITNFDLLSKAYKYRTIYKIETNNYNFPCLIQNKYIMIPFIENGEEKEVSLIQEHVIGSDDYVLSYGEPNKSLKLSINLK